VFLVDLANAMPKDSQYYRDLIHYSNAGSEQVAAIIYPALCPFLADQYPDFFQVPCP